MKILLRLASILTPAVLALSVIGIDAFALSVPATFAPRDFNTQQIGYFRVHVLATGNGIVANGQRCIVPVASASNCSVKVGAIPAEAFLLRQTQQIITNFDAATTDTIGFGTTTAGTEIKAAATVHTGAGAISSPGFVANSSGILLSTTVTTGAGKAQTGTNGGYDLYVNYAYTGATVATVGELVWILEYAAPNDGDCIATPMGSLPAAC